MRTGLPPFLNSSRVMYIIIHLINQPLEWRDDFCVPLFSSRFFCFGDAAISELGWGKTKCSDVILCGIRDNKNEDSLDEIFFMKIRQKFANQ
jgi:hypothetical protein